MAGAGSTADTSSSRGKAIKERQDGEEAREIGDKREANKGTGLKVRDNRKQYVQMSFTIADVRWESTWQNEQGNKAGLKNN